MTLAYLLDTNVILEALRPKPNKDLLARLKQHQTEMAVPSPVWHELLFGCQRLPAPAKRTAIEDFLQEVVAATMPILPYDEYAAAWHASERARLAAAGRTPPFVDRQIAAIAAVNQLVMVTFNVADFSDFEGLSIQDWRK